MLISSPYKFPSEDIKLDGITGISIKCKCGGHKFYYTLPLDNVYECGYCERRKNDSFFDNLFLNTESDSSPKITRNNWVIMAGVMVASVVLAWYVHKYFKNRR